VGQFLIFAALGLGLETAFTAALDWRKDPKRHLLGYSSLWYAPLYGLVPFAFARLWPVVGGWAWPLRGLAYMLLFFAVEYVGMRFLHDLLGESPSEASYRRQRWNVHGFIRLDFAPAWFAAGLILEYFYRHIIVLK